MGFGFFWGRVPPTELCERQPAPARRRCGRWDLSSAATSRTASSAPRPRSPPWSGQAPLRAPAASAPPRTRPRHRVGQGAPLVRPRPPRVSSHRTAGAVRRAPSRLRGLGRLRGRGGRCWRCLPLLRQGLRRLRGAGLAWGCAGARLCVRAPRADNWRGFPEGGKCHLIHTELFKSPHPRADTHTH